MKSMKINTCLKMTLLAVLVCSSSPTFVSTGATTGWKEKFETSKDITKWKKRIKPGTKPAIFSVEADPNTGLSFLHMEADTASATLIIRVQPIDLDETPIMRWRWRATTLPNGADGRISAKDDQAIGLYVGTGNMLNNKSVSYRWDTLTPAGEEGNCTYGLGTVKVKWYTLRNEKEASGGQWLTEERNVAEDFKKAWGYIPKTIYLSVSCNSQYTSSLASADLEWVEFLSVAERNK